MGKKLEGELLTAVLTAQHPVNGDLKRVLQQIAEKREGTIRINDVPDYDTDELMQAEFITKLEYYDKKTKETKIINATVLIDIKTCLYDDYWDDDEDDENWGRGSVITIVKELNISCIRAGFKGGKIHFNSTSDHFYHGNAMVAVRYDNASDLNPEVMLKQCAQQTAAEIIRTERLEESERKSEERKKLREIKTMQEIINNHGFEINDVTEKAYEMAKESDSYWNNKSRREIERDFAKLAVFLKGDPYAKREQQ
jgi:hypothetical protein